MRLCTRIRGEILDKKAEYRAQKKRMAVNEPQEYAQMKINEAERKKRRKREKTMEKRLGTSSSKRVKMI